VTKSGSQKPKPPPRRIKCFTCHKYDHKSPDCPKNRLLVKRVGYDFVGPKYLKPNECVVQIEGLQCAMTMDTGAEVTLVTKELVLFHNFTIEGEVGG